MGVAGLYYDNEEHLEFDLEDYAAIQKLNELSAKVAVAQITGENVEKAALDWYFASEKLFEFWIQLGCPRLPGGMEGGEPINYRLTY